MNKETLEEAIEQYCSMNEAINEDRAAWQDIEAAVKEGIRLQAEILCNKVDYISFIHLQNLNGRETNDEVFEAGILAGVIETEKKMYSEEEVIKLLEELDVCCTINPRKINITDWFKQFKKK